jgi:hypothetical protein
MDSHSASNTTDAAPPTIITMGDSKVAGTNTTLAQWGVTLKQMAWNRGFGNVLTADVGFGGENSYYMANTGIGTVMGGGGWANCALLLLNFGTNEGASGATGGAQSVAQTKANIEAVITAARNTGGAPAGKDADHLSIGLIGQTAGNRTGVAGYTLNDERIATLDSLFRQIAAEQHCFYFDPYTLYRRHHADANWQDVLDATPGNNAHPSDYFNGSMISDVGEMFFPSAMSGLVGFSGHKSFLFSGKDHTAAPSTYALGLTCDRAVSAAGAWPLDGIVLTYRAASHITVQLLFDRNTAALQFRISTGADDANWGAWKTVTLT